MKVGLSSYSLLDDIKAGKLTILDAIQWVADNGGEHMELVPYGYTVVDNVELADQIREKAAAAGIELSGYSFPANRSISAISCARMKIRSSGSRRTFPMRIGYTIKTFMSVLITKIPERANGFGRSIKIICGARSSGMAISSCGK